MSLSPPLRFLAVVLGGWAALRAAIIAPPWWAPPADAAGATARGEVRALGSSRARPQAGRQSRSWAEPSTGPDPSHLKAAVHAASGKWRSARLLPKAEAPLSSAPRASARIPGIESEELGVLPASSPRFAVAAMAGPRHAGPGRWSVSAWSFLRRGDGAPLATGGLLGGSQAGARLAFRLTGDPQRSVSLSARLSSPLGRAAGAEAALGLDWRPSRRIPAHLLAERRQALGREGRSAFGLTLHGGVGDAPLGRFRIDAYAQTGIVGARSRDLFADGSIRLSLPLGRHARLGTGAWAAAQPGVSRLDLGPQAALRLPVAGHAVTVAADWRLRVAGNAEPGSGPTLTLSTGF